MSQFRAVTISIPILTLSQAGDGSMFGLSTAKPLGRA
jgi:hypothetical protein